MHYNRKQADNVGREKQMKFVTSVLMFAATAGLALLALTTRKDVPVAQTIQNVDTQPTGDEPAGPESLADSWFV